MKECLIVFSESRSVAAMRISNLIRQFGYRVRLLESEKMNSDAEKQNPADLIIFTDVSEKNSQLAVSDRNSPALFITDDGTDEQLILKILENGEDYLQEPFSEELFLTKIRSLIRRRSFMQQNRKIPVTENLDYLPSSGIITDGQNRLILTGSKRKVMDLLASRRPDVISRQELMMILWQTDEFICDGSLTTCISRLRRKIREIWKKPLIETRKGAGYRIP